jgi:hypothetical protein
MKKSTPIIVIVLIISTIALIACFRNRANNQGQSSNQDIYNQLKAETYYRIDNNELFISYDNGNTYVDTQLTIPQNIGSFFTRDNIYISSNITAVVLEVNTSAYIYVSKDKCTTWTKTTLNSAENDKFITSTTYNPPTLSFAEAFIGFSSDMNGWVVFGGDIAMGNENNFVFQTTDGGQTWHETNNSSDTYGRVLTGAGYIKQNIGFLCFRYHTTMHGPIYSTDDGGKTWNEVPITYPSKYNNTGLTPASPRFHGNYGIIPICSTDYADYNNVLFYLYTKDAGKTWSTEIPD